MHELSIAQSIVEIVGQYVPPGGQQQVRRVNVRIGAMAGVVPDSLEFCFAALIHHTPLQDAVLETETVPFRITCRACGRTTESEPGIALCAACGSADTAIVSGTELQVVSIDVDEA